MRPFPCGGFYHPDNIVGVDGRINIRRLPVDGDHRRFPNLPSCHTVGPIDGKVQFLPPLREQPVVGKLHLHGGIRHCQPAVIVNFNPAVVKVYKNKVVALLIKIQADSNRRHQQAVLFDILLKDNLLHHLFSP